MRFLDAGESHGKALVAIIEGLPSGLEIDFELINSELARRQKGYGRGERMKIESDRAQILSGVRGGFTLGSPLAIMIENLDHEKWTDVMGVTECDSQQRVVSEVRPGHADYVGCVKYGFDDARNVLERASARETAIRVAVGAIAKQYLKKLGIEIGSHVISLGGVDSENAVYSAKDLINADLSPVRCMDKQAEKAMMQKIDDAKKAQETLGGVVEIVVSGMPVGIGSYVHYDRKLDYALMGAVGSVQSVKGVMIGNDTTALLGSQAHDKMYPSNSGVVRKTNNAGGIEGGVSNGEDIVIRAYLKPIPTVMSGLETVDIRSNKAVKSSPERSDVCAVPSAGVVIESAVAFAIADKISECLGGDSMSEVIDRLNKKRSAK